MMTLGAYEQIDYNYDILDGIIKEQHQQHCIKPDYPTPFAMVRHRLFS